VCSRGPVEKTSALIRKGVGSNSRGKLEVLMGGLKGGEKEGWAGEEKTIRRRWGRGGAGASRRGERNRGISCAKVGGVR